MQIEQFKDFIARNKKGSYVSITYKSDPHQLKRGGNHIVEKLTTTTCRFGVSYANMKVNADRDTGSLPFGNWVQGYENYLIEYNGNIYVRVNTTQNGSNKPVTLYYCDGKETTKQELIDNGIISNTKPKEHMLVYNVKLENVVSIG